MSDKEFKTKIKKDHIVAIGPERGDDGVDFFDLNIKMWNKILELKLTNMYKLIEVYDLNEGYLDEITFKKSDIPTENFNVFDITASNHSSKDTDDLEHIKNYYINY